MQIVDVFFLMTVILEGGVLLLA